MPKKSKGVRKCPEDLNLQIVLTNLLPLDVEIPDLMRYVRTNNKFIKEQISKERKRIKQIFGETLGNLTTKTLFYDVCIENTLRAKDIPAELQKTEYQITLRKVLKRQLDKFPKKFSDPLQLHFLFAVSFSV